MPKQARTNPVSLIDLILPVLIPDTPPGACPRLQRRRKRLWENVGSRIVPVNDQPNARVTQLGERS